MLDRVSELLLDVVQVVGLLCGGVVLNEGTIHRWPTQSYSIADVPYLSVDVS